MKGGAMTSAMRVIASLLEARTGQILGDSRMWRMETSLKPLMRAHGLPQLEDVAARIAAPEGAGLAEEVVNALLNNETSFFRDHHMFQQLASRLLPALASAPGAERLRIWCAGCSSGQEPYSLAMLVRRDPFWSVEGRVSILATDISTAAIARAKAGRYSQMDVQRGLGINDLLRWFEPVGEDWQISPELRRMIDFRAENLFDGTSPGGHYDIILCRNLLLYFPPERRSQLFARLGAHSAPGGLLMLGAGETVIGQSGDFQPSADFRGAYQRVAAQARPPLAAAS